MKPKTIKALAFFTGQILIACSLLCAFSAEYTVKQLASVELVNRDPQISRNGMVVWQAGKRGAKDAATDIYMYWNGKTNIISEGQLDKPTTSARPMISGSNVVWQATVKEIELEAPNFVLAEVPLNPTPIGEVPDDIDPNILRTNTFSRERQPGGDNEIVLWNGGAIQRITKDYRNDLGPQISGDLVTWQKAKGWPFGWEIMLYEKGKFHQLTTNFFYDMAPVVDKTEAVWYGWDGNDFEIFHYDHTSKIVTQITSNQFDDVSPKISDGIVVWEAYPAVESDIFIWMNNSVEKLSSNVEDDLNPSIWNGQVVWQGFDGDDFEIYYFDGRNTIKLTSNLYDDINPTIQDGTIAWIGYHENWDAEIFTWANESVTMLTTNSWDDRAPSTANGSVVWYSDNTKESKIFLAEPKTKTNPTE